MKTYLEHLLEKFRTSFWFTPTVFAVAALTLAFVMVWLDSLINSQDFRLSGWLRASDADGARQLLAVISGSMITVAGVVFSITIVALTMASAQLGPKLLRNYMRDRANQIVLGTFIANFVYCLIVMRYVRGDDIGKNVDAFVPYLAVTFSLLLALASLGVLIYFFHHLSSTIQADNVIANIGRELNDAIDRWPDDNEEIMKSDLPMDARNWEQVRGSRGLAAVLSETTGYIQSVDYSTLVQLAERYDICLRLKLRAGHFVIKHSKLLDYVPATDAHEQIEHAVREAFIFGRQRSPTQDIEYMIDQINQVALRALSPSMNDPYTALVCADWLSAAIARLAVQEFPSPLRFDSQDRLRLIRATLTFEGIVNTAFDELRQAARPLASVTIRLLDNIAGIMSQTLSDTRLAVLKQQADMIERGSHGLFEELDRQDVQARYRKILELLPEKRNRHQPAIERG
ncbi:MAG: DUF2254 domain-containing protein [Pseudomonadota bacterium]|nr:DUF2254 domain-containing protein [Pseudomonadota bacterium]